MKMTSLLFATLFLLGFCFDEANADEWVTDRNTGCKVWEWSLPHSAVSWSGECTNGYASGSGTLIGYWGRNPAQEGERYVGSMKDGKFHGKGTYSWSDGRKYEGDWVEDKRTGKGIYIAKNNAFRYEGDFVDDKPHGKGTYTFTGGVKYTGDVVNGEWSGTGTWTCANGKKFSGQFEKGKPVGFIIKCE
jgi:hypothetical protein